MATPDDQYIFEDLIFVTGKALKRMILVAKRVCGMPDEFELPDSDDEAATLAARFIWTNATGKQAVVEIIDTVEKVLIESGPDAGRFKDFTRKRVAFAGYEEVGKAEPSPANDGSVPAGEEPPGQDANQAFDEAADAQAADAGGLPF